MRNEKEINEFESIVSFLKSSLQKYINYKIDSNNKSCISHKNQAYNDMTYIANNIERKLKNPLVFNVISNGHQFQFEQFERYVDIDLPGYIDKIESKLEQLKSEIESE